MPSVRRRAALRAIDEAKDFGNRGKCLKRDQGVDVEFGEDFDQIRILADRDALIEGDPQDLFCNMPLTAGDNPWRILPPGVVTQGNRLGARWWGRWGGRFSQKQGSRWLVAAF